MIYILNNKNKDGKDLNNINNTNNLDVESNDVINKEIIKLGNVIENQKVILKKNERKSK